MKSSDLTIWKVLLECLAGLFVGLVLVLLVFGAIPALVIWIAKKSIFLIIGILLVLSLLLIKIFEK